MAPSKLLLLALAVAPLLAAGACGNDVDTSGTGGAGAGTTTSTGGAAPTTPDSYCEGRVARDAACNGTPTETVAECLASPNTNCLFDLARDEIVAALVACLNGRPCSEGDDLCFYQVGADAPVTGQAEYQTACTTKHDACVTGFSTDYCGFTIGSSATFATLTACFDLACADVKACLDGALPASCQ
ncbi:MAG: hypothetical protein IT373_28560 [Polyangiaceae bacterium]|nr:hypothetical protein [Polyangiaceae bacterium]